MATETHSETARCPVTVAYLHNQLKVDLCLTKDGEFQVRFALQPHFHSTVLHWGLMDPKDPGAWIPPKKDHLNAFTSVPPTQFVEGAASTPFADHSGEQSSIVFRYKVCKNDPVPFGLWFVLHKPPSEWIKNGNANFALPLQASYERLVGSQRLEAFAAQIVGTQLQTVPSHLLSRQTWNVSHAQSAFALSAFAFADHPDQLKIYILAHISQPVVLHWGLKYPDSEGWKQADITHLVSTATEDFAPSSQSCFNSKAWDREALQTRFQFIDDTEPYQYVRVILRPPNVAPSIEFILKEHYANVWLKNDNNTHFCLALPQNPLHLEKQKLWMQTMELERQRRAEIERAKAAAWTHFYETFMDQQPLRRSRALLTFQSIPLSEDIGVLDAIINFNEALSCVHVLLVACAKVPLILHWGVVPQSPTRKVRRYVTDEWTLPNPEYFPPNTTIVDPEKSCETEFQPCGDLTTLLRLEAPHVESTEFVQTIEIAIPAQITVPHSDKDCGVLPDAQTILCVLREKASGAWFKSHTNTDIAIRLTSSNMDQWQGDHIHLVEQILNAEMGTHHMTLMHRFQLLNSSLDFYARAHHGALSQEPQLWAATHRAKKAVDVHTTDFQAPKSHTEFFAWILIWARLSFIGVLDWQRNYNTRPRELSSSIDTLTLTVAQCWVNYVEYRSVIRHILSHIPRGVNSGQAIRDRILEIMHKHRIPETKGNFYEQWHQKLHNNTTPDDIPICLGIINYLKSGGNIREFWDTLSAHGLTAARLRSYDRPLTLEPFMVQCDVGSLIQDFEAYLSILKDVHDALDLEKAHERAARFLSAEASQRINEIIQTAQTKNQPGRPTVKGLSSVDVKDLEHKFFAIAHARKEIGSLLVAPNIEAYVARELLFLDIALEQQQCLLFQSDTSERIELPRLTEMVETMLWTMSANSPHDIDLHLIWSDWSTLASKCALSGCFSGPHKTHNALLLNALVDRLALYVGNLTVDYENLLKPKVQYLGQHLGTEQAIINVFVDDMLRSTILFAISFALKFLTRKLNALIQLPPWQLISFVPCVRGRLTKIDHLHGIQNTRYAEPTILVTASVSGEEEIPLGVCGVLITSKLNPPDVLSHISVRARNTRCLLAVCTSEAICESLQSLVGDWVEIQVDSSSTDVRITKTSGVALPSLTKQQSWKLEHSYDRQASQTLLYTDLNLLGQKASQFMDLSQQSSRWIVLPELFSSEVVGSKSFNLKRLQTSLATLKVDTPAGVALPFNCFQKALNSAENCKHNAKDRLRAILQQIQPDTSNDEAEKLFREAHQVVITLECPSDFKEEFRKALENDAQLRPLHHCVPLDASWKCICEVWASMFAMRPWISLSKAQLTYSNLSMAVLVQNLLPAQYAFVLHTQNPLTSDASPRDEMYGELVVGLGETLVASTPGRALAWTMERNRTNPQIKAFPSKSYALFGDNAIIFRSDSNSEDLEHFAGAGLFESVCTPAPIKTYLTYGACPVIVDALYRDDLLARISKVAFEIQDIFGRPMDIEGVVFNRMRIGIVQARPQIL